MTWNCDDPTKLLHGMWVHYTCSLPKIRLHYYYIKVISQGDNVCIISDSIEHEYCIHCPSWDIRYLFHSRSIILWLWWCNWSIYRCYLLPYVWNILQSNTWWLLIGWFSYLIFTGPNLSCYLKLKNHS